jgi:hypothetical protein
MGALWSDPAFIMPIIGSLLVGVFVVYTVAASILSPDGRWRSRWGRRLVSANLTEWGVLSLAEGETQRAMLLRKTSQLGGSFATGVGAGAMLAFAGMACVEALFRGLLGDSSGPSMSAITSGFFVMLIAMLVASVAGYARGARVLASATGPIYRPQPRRSVWEYCSPIVWLGAVVLYALIAALQLTVAAQASDLTFRWMGSSQHWPALALGEAQALGAIAVPIVALLCALGFARSPVQINTESRALAQRFADYFRTRMISWALWAPLPMGALGLEFALLDIPYNAHSGILGAINALLAPAPMLALALYAALFFIFMPGITTGRLGGRLTGWWWQRWPDRRERAATEGG